MPVESKKRPLAPWLRRAVSCGLLVVSSLVAALAMRYAWLRILVSEAPVTFSALPDATHFTSPRTVLSAALIGSVLLWLYHRRARSNSLSPLSDAAFLALFYVGLGVAMSVLGEADPFELLRVLPLAAVTGLAGQLSYTLVFPTASDGRRVSLVRSGTLALDAIGVAAAVLFAYLVRFDGWPVEPYGSQLLVAGPVLIAVFLISCGLWGVHSFMWQFTSIREAVVIAQATSSAAIVLLLLRLTVLSEIPRLRIPIGVLLVLPIFVYFHLISMRILRRLALTYPNRSASNAATPAPRRVLLVGAGAAGQTLVRELERRPEVELVGFVDDDPAKLGTRIHGLEVLGSSQDLEQLGRQLGIDRVILSMPSADPGAVLRIVLKCEEAGLETFSVPSFAELALQKMAMTNLRPVRMEDLLGRTSLTEALRDETLRHIYWSKRILVTGAAGSIGSELVRQLAQFEPVALILLDRDENGLYEIGLEMKDDGRSATHEVICDVRERDRLAEVFALHRPEVVFHAAAFKHVPLMEHHPSEAIRNNVLGSQNTIELAAEFCAERFVLISTDKAVNPSSIMGASKRVAEMVLKSVSGGQAHTRFCCVRFGNVLGSRASVVPLFQRQIKNKRKVSVTHAEVQRYFMTIPEAVQLVVQAGSLGSQGEVFLLDMGDPVRIIDLATELIELSGLVPHRDVEIEFTGLRPGEKLTEELLVSTESGVRDTRFSKIFVATSEAPVSASQKTLIEELIAAANARDDDEVRKLLSPLDIGWTGT